MRTPKTAGGEVQQDNYNLWAIREELEHDVTDNYSLSLYLRKHWSLGVECRNHDELPD